VTRRLALEQRLYEEAPYPTLQDEQERILLLELRRSANNPTLTEILAAKPLNDLFNSCRRIQGWGTRFLYPRQEITKIVTSGSGVTSACSGTTAG